MENVREKLEQISTHNGIEILYACETGSRAWGFPSPDSDYDVRFIYKHSNEWYLCLHTQKDSIEVMDGTFDASGWDLRKSLLLLKKSNVPLIERFQSPIVYYEANGFKEEFNNLVKLFYNPIAAFHHHYALAKKFQTQIDTGAACKLKSLFYLLRSLLSCNWILHNDHVLPMHMAGLMQYNEAIVNNEIEELIFLKSFNKECYTHRVSSSLRSWTAAILRKIEAGSVTLKVNNTGIEAINEYFLKSFYDNNRYC